MQQEEEAEDRRDRRRVEAEIAGRTIWDAAAMIDRIERDSRRADELAESKEPFSKYEGKVRRPRADRSTEARARKVDERRLCQSASCALCIATTTTTTIGIQALKSTCLFRRILCPSLFLA